MNAITRQAGTARRRISIRARFGFVALATAITLAVSIMELTAEASGDVIARPIETPRRKVDPTPTPEGQPASNVPVQSTVTRVRVAFGEKRDLQLATQIDSFILVSPEIATAELKNKFTLNITGLQLGETILLLTTDGRRQTYMVDVVVKPRNSSKTTSENLVNTPAATSGSVSVSYTQGFNGGPSVLRQNIDVKHQVSSNKIVRASGELFKLFGSGDQPLIVGQTPGIAVNRVSFGLDTPNRTIDFLDSQLEISSLSFNNYTMRGFHVSRRTKPSANDNSPAKGLEVFAGVARPSSELFETGSGFIGGVVIPFVATDTFRARVGVMGIAPRDATASAPGGGTVVHVDGRYMPTPEFSADAEVSYANGRTSWRGRLDLKFAKYGGSAEVTNLARTSPLNTIGAQPGGRRSSAFSLYWRPTSSIHTSAGYNHSRVERQTGSRLADYARSQLFAGGSIGVAPGTRITFRFLDQNIETAVPGSLSKFSIATRTFVIGNNLRFHRHWSNSFEARVTLSRESKADAGLENGLSIHEQFRYAWRGGSVTGFFDYVRNTPSLPSLLIRNPQLLPPHLQAAFSADPAGFLRLYRDRLASLLGGVDLPVTGSLDTGVRFQRSSSLFTVTGEIRQASGRFLDRDQKQLFTTASVGVRLDNANSFQLNAWRSFGASSQTGFTVSYTHRFGAGTEGFQLSRLFRFGRTKIKGRVFYDLNGNGIADPVEPGVSAIKVRINDKESATTDGDGQYELFVSAGYHTVSLDSPELGLRLLATTGTAQSVTVGHGKGININFGVRDFGSIIGRVFNDTDLSGQVGASSHGLAGLRVVLRSVEVGHGNFTLERATAADGTYEFPNLRPGKYWVEIDLASLPPNFDFPETIRSQLSVEALRTSKYDIPLAAQRSITGVVYLDIDGDLQYSPAIDRPIAGATIMTNYGQTVSDSNGAYIIRNLPAGGTEVVIRRAGTGEIKSVNVELGIEPTSRLGVNVGFPVR